MYEIQQAEKGIGRFFSADEFSNLTDVNLRCRCRNKHYQSPSGEGYHGIPVINRDGNIFLRYGLDQHPMSIWGDTDPRDNIMHLFNYCDNRL